MSRQSGELGWYDLGDADVYHMACLEYEAREAALNILGQAATSSVLLQEIDRARTILANHEDRAAMWLTDQALARGLRPLSPNDASIAAEQFSAWFAVQYAEAQRSYRQLEKLFGVSKTSLNSIYIGTHGRPSREMVAKIAEGFADLRGLQGGDREQFIREACTKAGYR